MSKRPAMLGSVIRNIIAPVLRECPQVCGVVAITAVDVSRDYTYATVYVSALEHPETALQFLEERHKDLQKSLHVLSCRRIPRLRFRLDPTSQQGQHIDELLKTLEE